MRKIALVLALAVALVCVLAVVAHAEVQTLPAKACNQGTMNAHERVPEMNGNGAPITAHDHIPDAESGTCSHLNGR